MNYFTQLYGTAFILRFHDEGNWIMLMFTFTMHIINERFCHIMEYM